MSMRNGCGCRRRTSTAFRGDGGEGNHGQDVKEYYFYLDATPTSSYLKMLYKYPARGKLDPEYELLDTGVFADDRYFDVEVEYAKATPDDILMQITVHNRGPDDPRCTC